MMTRTTGKGLKAAVALAILSIGMATASVIPSRAATTAPGHPNVIQRHPTMAGIAVGAGVHHALKVSAARKKRNHQHLSFAERHPTMSGFAAGFATHHLIKRTTH